MDFGSEEKKVDLKRIISLVFRHFYLYLISLIVGIIIAIGVYKMSTPLYTAQTKMKIEIENENKSPDSFIEDQLYFYQSNEIEDQIQVLTSYTQIKKVVEELDFSYQILKKEKYLWEECYPLKPFIIEIDTTSYYPLNIMMKICFINDSSYVLSIKEKELLIYVPYTNYHIRHEDVEIIDTFIVDKQVESEFFKFKLHSQGFSESGKINYFLRFNSKEGLIKQFSLVEAEKIDNSSIVDIKFKGTNPNKICDFLNCLTEVYIEKEMEHKNTITEKIIHFIDEQLKYAFDSLNLTEKKLSEFKRTKNVMNVELHTTHSYELLNVLQERKANLLIESKYYDYLKTHINDEDEDALITPASMNISNPVLNQLILDLIQLYSDRHEIKENTIKNNPVLQSINSRIVEQRNNIISTIIDIQNKNQLEIDEITKRINKTTLQINSLPETQRKLVDIERVYNLNDAIYTFLLTKKSEMQIAHAANIPRSEVLLPALPEYIKKESPDFKKNLIIAILLSIMVPSALVYLKILFSNKIFDLNDIQAITQHPIFGHILRDKCQSNKVCLDFPKTSVAESFRTLRTNLNFSSENSKVFLITSSMKGEGKSFISSNIAISLALLNKKVILLGFDLRNPSIHKNFGLDNDKGLSLLLSGNQKLNDVLQKSVENNLDLILSGPVPPNPLELVASNNSRDLIEKLRENYDYIIIDSPPLGIVSDAVHLSYFADANILIIRQNITNQVQFRKTIKEIDTNSSKPTYLILNDIKEVKGVNKYLYNYNYAYSQNYYG